MKPRFDLGPAKLAGLLQIQPDPGRCPELARQAQRGVGGHATLTVQDRRSSGSLSIGSPVADQGELLRVVNGLDCKINVKIGPVKMMGLWQCDIA